MYLGRWITATRIAPPSSGRSTTPPAAEMSGFSSPISRSPRDTDAGEYELGVAEGGQGRLAAADQRGPVGEEQVVEVAIEEACIGRPQTPLHPVGIAAEEPIGDELEVLRVAGDPVGDHQGAGVADQERGLV